MMIQTYRCVLCFFIILALPFICATELLADDPTYDLVIQNGRIIDGAGNPAFFADIGIRNGRIAAIEYRRRLAGTLSGGERQMLTLASGLMSSPRLLLLDEPSLGLAPTLVTEVMRLIAEMRDRGLSVLLVEQNARAALRIADRGYVMEGGRITIKGTAEQLLSDERVKSAYLGGKSR